MNLPNGDRAIIPMTKLTDYCLNLSHNKGKHKARVFKAILNITTDNVDQLHDLIQQAAIEGEVVQQEQTPQGQIFKVDWEYQIPIVATSEPLGRFLLTPNFHV